MGYFNTGNYNFGESTPEENDSAVNFLNEYDRKKKEEEDAAIAEQARIDAENNKSIWQKAGEYVSGQAKFVKDNPIQAAKNVGSTFVSGIKAAGEDISGVFAANIYNDTNEKIFAQKQEQMNLMLDRIRKEADPEKRKNLIKIMQDYDNSVQGIDVFKEVPVLNKKPSQVYADFAMMGLDMLGFTALGAGLAKDASGQLVKSGIKGVGANLGVAATKETGYKIATETLVKKTFFKSVLEGAGWGAAYGGGGGAQQGDDWQGIKNKAITGAVFGGGLAAAGYGASKVFEKMKEAPMKKIRDGLTDEYDQHLISGINDAKMAKELLDNGSKSLKVSASLPESLAHVGEDLTKRTTEMATEEGQRALAGGVVTSKMSQNARRAVYKEIVDSGLFKIEKGDSVDSVIQRGIESVLANGKNVRGNLSLTSKYTDSVLGVVNPALSEMDQTIAEVSAKGATRPEHQKALEDALNSGDKVAIKQAFDSIPEGDPYKESMRSLLPEDMQKPAPTAMGTTPEAKPTEKTPSASVKTPTSESPEVSTAKAGETIPSAKPEAKFQEKTGVSRKIHDDLMDSEKGAQIFDEMATAEAGFRKRGAELADGQGAGFETISQKSSFPKWVPETYTKENGKVVSLRSRKLFDEVQSHMLNGTVPTDETQLALYDIVHNELRLRSDMPQVTFPTEGRVFKAERLTPDKPINAIGEKDISRLSKRYEEMFPTGQEITTHTVASNREQIAKAVTLVNDDYQKAIRIATGAEKSDDVLSNIVATAVLDKARKEGDVATERLVLTRTIDRATRGGQETQALRNLTNDDSAFGATKNVINTRRAEWEKRNVGKKVSGEVDKTITEIESKIPKPTTNDWSDFINKIRC